MSVKALRGAVVESQVQIGWPYPDCTSTLWLCIAAGSRMMWDGFRRWHEGFADFSDILSRYIKSLTSLLLLHLPPVAIGFLDQHIAFPLPDGDEAVLGLVLIIVLHLNVDLSWGNRQFCHDTVDCPVHQAVHRNRKMFISMASWAELLCWSEAVLGENKTRSSAR